MSEQEQTLKFILDELRIMNSKVDILMADKNFRDGESKSKEKTTKIVVSLLAGFISLVVTIIYKYVERLFT